MAQFLIVLAGVLVLAALGWGIFALLIGQDPGLEPAEPDGRAVPLPTARPLTETDIGALRFDTAPRGYRMVQVDSALRRAAYDLGYKEELIGVLEAEVAALRDGRLDEAEALRQAREAASRPQAEPESDDEPADGEPVADEATGDGEASLGTFEIGAGPTIGALPGQPAAGDTASEETAAGPAGSGATASEDAAAEPATAEDTASGPAAEDTAAEDAAELAETAEPEGTAEPAGAVGETAGSGEPPAVETVEEPEAAAEPDDSVDTDLATARTAASDEVRPADGER